MTVPINSANSPTLDQSQSAQRPEVRSNGKEAVANSSNVAPLGPLGSKSDTQPVQQDLEIAISNINDFVQNIQRSIHFNVSESSGRTIIEVYDTQTEELIREIPSEEVQRISEAISEQLNEGLLVKINI